MASKSQAQEEPPLLWPSIQFIVYQVSTLFKTINLFIEDKASIEADMETK